MELCNLLKWRGTVIDNVVFRLHYKVTFSLLLILSIVIGYHHFFGISISCSSGASKDLVDEYCYLHMTFSIEEAWQKKVGEEIPYPGVGKYSSDMTLKYHTYYPWVPLVLFLQAILFCIPRYFWLSLESGRIHEMTVFGKHQKAPHDSLSALVNDMVYHLNSNTGYFYSYLLAEVCNLLNVIGQIYLMNCFLGNELFPIASLFYIPLGRDFQVNNDPWMRIFPTVAKCTFHTEAPSGDISRHDTICLLPINMFHAKVYGFLFVWFLILSILTCLAVSHRLLFAFSPLYRYLNLKLRLRFHIIREVRETLCQYCAVGDWFIICLLSKNSSSSSFRDFLSMLTRRIDGERKQTLEDEHESMI